jgi:hypothetical protein
MCPVEVTFCDKLVHYIQLKVPEYKYSQGNGFNLLAGAGHPTIEDWTFSFEKPTIEEIEAIDLVKICPRSCHKCLIERVKELEAKIKDIEDIIIV